MNVFRADEPGLAEVIAFRTELERQLLITSESLHTERGHHIALMRPWGIQSVIDEYKPQLSDITFEQATEHLLVSCFHSAVIASLREANKWMSGQEHRIARLIEEGKISVVKERPKLVALSATLERSYDPAAFEDA